MLSTVFDRLTLGERGTVKNHTAGLVLTQSLKEGYFSLTKNSLVVIYNLFLAEEPFFSFVTPRFMLFHLKPS